MRSRVFAVFAAACLLPGVYAFPALQSQKAPAGASGPVSSAPLNRPAQRAIAQPPDSHLIFQSFGFWSPRTNLNADTVMVYGIDDTTAARIRSWRAHGYRVTVMTGVAWGPYATYLRGDFDGKEHWNQTQQDRNGNLILHGSREVPYI